MTHPLDVSYPLDISYPLDASYPLDILRKTLRAENLDGCIVTRNSDLRWLTGWEYVFDSGRPHTALITSDAALIHTDTRYSAAMRLCNAESLWQVDDERITQSAFIAQAISAPRLSAPQPSAPHLSSQTVSAPQPSALRLSAQTVSAPHSPAFQPSAPHVSASQPEEPAQSLRIAIEDDLPLNCYRALEKALVEAPLAVKLIEASNLILNLRAIKRPAEIEILRQAQRIGDAAFVKLLEWMRPGLTEAEIACELEYLMRKNGADGVAFASIIASGPNSANPHAVPTSRALERGDFVVVDFGARYRDYCADVTRTLVVGQASDEQRAVYKAVLAAHEAAKALIRPGLRGDEVHECARAVLAEHGYAEYFAHSLGHGIGVSVHELPHLAPRADTILALGNVVTVEPGAYILGFGGVRIEDSGIVTESGFDPLTTLPHDLIII